MSAKLVPTFVDRGCHVPAQSCEEAQILWSCGSFQFTPSGLSSTYFCQSQSQSHITTHGQSVSLSWCQAPIWDPRPIFSLNSLIIFRQLRVCWCGAPSLTRSRVCSFQFLPGIARVAFLGSDSHGTHDHILLSLFLNLPQPGGPGSSISPRNKVAQLYLQASGSGSGQSVLVSSPHLGPTTKLLLLSDICGFLYWGVPKIVKEPVLTVTTLIWRINCLVSPLCHSELWADTPVMLGYPTNTSNEFWCVAVWKKNTCHIFFGCWFNKIPVKICTWEVQSYISLNRTAC
jgi:hypothetical protein